MKQQINRALLTLTVIALAGMLIAAFPVGNIQPRATDPTATVPVYYPPAPVVAQEEPEDEGYPAPPMPTAADQGYPAPVPTATATTAVIPTLEPTATTDPAAPTAVSCPPLLVDGEWIYLQCGHN